MGGHGGLNILPQKKWNVYRADRQYEVKYDEHRDIENRLADLDKRKRKRLTDSLVELRRKSQGVCNMGPNNSDCGNSDDVSAHKTSRRRERRSRSSKELSHKNVVDKSICDGNNRSRSRSLECGSIRIVDPLDEVSGMSDPPCKVSTVDVDNQVSLSHINLFEDAEREAEEHLRKHREGLIKNGAYVYNSNGKGPRSVNIYTDDASVTLVPDIREVSTPWYMKERSADCDVPVRFERKGGPRYLKSVSTFERPSVYSEEDDLHKAFANKLAQFYNKRALPKG